MGKDERIGIHFVSHPSEDEWEEYAFGRLGESQVARVEAHLLACGACQATLERVDGMIQSLRSAVPEALAPPTGSPAPLPGFPAGERWFPFPIRPAMVVLSLALALILAVAVGVVGSPRGMSKLPVAAVTLASFRGESTATAPAQRPLDLEISQSDIPSATSYSLEVVTTAGDSVWKGTPEIAGGKLIGHIPKGLGRGAYWVRLFGPQTDLIREFGLRVK